MVRARVTVRVQYKVGVRARIAFFFFLISSIFFK